jgi:hypothetical protein
MAKWLPNLRSSLFLAIVSLLLAGCFESEQPKFPLASAAAPFGEGGRYVVYERVENDQYQRQEVFVIKRRPDRAYDFVNEKSEVIRISLHAIGGDLFAGQANSEQEKDKDKPAYAYVVFRVTGSEALLYIPQCDEQHKATLATFQVEIGRFECMIDRVADPPALFKRLDLGKPMSKLVRESADRPSLPNKMDARVKPAHDDG